MVSIEASPVKLSGKPLALLLSRDYFVLSIGGWQGPWKMKKRSKRTKNIPVQNTGIPAQSSRDAANRERRSLPSKMIPIILSSLTVLGFFLMWFGAFHPNVDNTWDTAIMLMKSSRETKDPAKKRRSLAEAGSLLKQVSITHPYHARVWLIYGYYFMEQKNWDSVIICERKAIELGKGGTVNQVEYQASDWICYALSMKMSGIPDQQEPNETLNALKGAEVRDFDNPCLLKMQGAEYTNLNKPDSALLYLNKVASIQPDADIYYNIGVNYFKKGQRESAVQYFNKALSVDKNYEPAKKMVKELSIVAR